MIFSHASSLPRPLHLRWWGFAACCFAALIIGYAWLATTTWGHANRWIGLATAVALLQLGLLYTHLPQNHRPQESEILPTFGLGNTLTLARGIGLAMLAGFLFSPQPVGALAWFPVLLYTLSDVLDALDGYAARKTNHATRLGATLDMEFDALGLGVITLLAIGYGSLPWWFLSLALARYLFVLGLAWRKRRGLPVYELTVSGYRRTIAGYTMGAMSVSIWPIVPPEAMTLGGAVYLAVLLALFGRDWLVASGRLDPSHPRYVTARQKLFAFVNEWLPVLLRPAVAILLTTTRILPPAHHPHWTAVFQRWELPPTWVAPAAPALAWITLILALGVVLGIHARWFALALLLPVNVQIAAVGLNWHNGALLVAVLLVALTNSGRFSLWRPYEPWVYAPPGHEAT